jgi:hypothetical protein
MTRKPKPPEVHTSWYVEAPRLSRPHDDEPDFSLWHRTEAEARRTFAEHVARVAAIVPHMAHFVRLVRVDRCIVEEGRHPPT